MSLPNCAGRFPPLCATTLPEVTNYDYESNLLTRGIDNRDFRWEEVYVDSSWLFMEATASGQLEYVPLSATMTSRSGQLTITHPSTSYTGYSGWVLTGGYTAFIGQSGSYFYSGNLTGYTGQAFMANPIEGNQSVGLWCNSSNIPKIMSYDIANYASGIQDDQRHQVFLTAYGNKYTGSQPRLKAYIQAFTGVTTLGYYDPISRAWGTTLPTGSFSISTSTYTEVKYSFSPSSLPFNRPTSYKLVVENPVTGAFITVDDLHVDQYLEKDPYQDYILPTGYLIQITPDLGWHNSIALFDGNNGSRNPYLKTLGPYATERGNFVDNRDNSATATIDSGDFASAMVGRYSKYLWRAVPLSPLGDAGDGGLPEKFEYVGSTIEKDFEVLSVREDPASPIKVIIGRRNSRITVLVNNTANYPGLEYPSDTTWKLSYYLAGIHEVLNIQGKDKGGATTTSRYIEVSNNSYKAEVQPIWNIFDEHGVLLDLKRLPAESNTDYKSRLKDVMKNRGGPSYQGVANSSTRELGLKKIEDGIVLSCMANSLGNSIHKGLEIEFGSTYAYLRSQEMEITETVFVDPVYLTADLSKYITEHPKFVMIAGGPDIPLSQCSVDSDEDRPSISRVKIDAPGAGGRYITITYKYAERLQYKDYPNVGDLITALNGLQDHTGNKLLTANLSMQLSGNEDCLGLFIVSSSLTYGEQLSIPWTPIKLRRISDRAFREYFELSDNSFHGTKFQKYVDELVSNSRTLWGSVEADRDFWDAVDSTKDSFDFVPTIFDPEIARYHLSGENRYVDGTQAWGRSFVGDNNEAMMNRGLFYKMFHPGVAHKNDLTPGIHSTYLKPMELEDPRSNISVDINDNNMVLFSGQR